MALINHVEIAVPEAYPYVTDVLNHIDHDQLSKYAITAHGYTWRDLLPYMKLVYTPLNQRCSPFASICMEIVLLGLQLALAKEDERTTLQKQGLLDYLTCLPWRFPKGSTAQKRAKSIVDMVGSHIQLQPPKLYTMVKSKLATMYFGLEKVLNSDCHILVEEIGMYVS